MVRDNGSFANASFFVAGRSASIAASLGHEPGLAKILAKNPGHVLRNPCYSKLQVPTMR